MRLTPLDVQSHRFSHRLRGYDAREVDDFNRMVAEDYEAVLREAESLREHVRHLEQQVEEMSGREVTLRRTLLTAQEVSDDLKRTASKEAEVIVAEAEVKAEKVLDAAHRRVARLAEEIREMKLLRTRIAESVRSAIGTHLALLEGLATDPPEDPLLDGKVAFLTRTKKSPPRTIDNDDDASAPRTSTTGAAGPG